MTRLVLVLILIVVLLLVFQHTPAPPEDPLSAADRILQYGTHADDFMSRIETTQIFSKDSIRYVFLVTSTTSRAYIPPQRISMTLVKRHGQWAPTEQTLVKD
ncbi:MAG: hypothetical protein KDC45_06885 [Bacteroidetes bacterium]|nr:hypothetical protein [Bacteroidota bacterium]